MSQTRFTSYDFPLPFGALAQNLVNSFDETHVPPDYLQTPQDLQALLARHELQFERVSLNDLKAARALRDEVREVFEARSTARAIQLVNAMLDRVRIRVQVQRKASSIALDWRPDNGDSLIDQLRGAVAVNLMLLLERFGMERFRLCAALPCRDVFVDVSKNGARRYCGTACANRLRVAQFRERQREE